MHALSHACTHARTLSRTLSPAHSHTLRSYQSRGHGHVLGPTATVERLDGRGDATWATRTRTTRRRRCTVASRERCRRTTGYLCGWGEEWKGEGRGIVDRQRDSDRDRSTRRIYHAARDHGEREIKESTSAHGKHLPPAPPPTACRLNMSACDGSPPAPPAPL